MNNTILLQFEKTTTNLVGNRMGNKAYKEKVAPKIDENSINTVVFPDIIEDIASSFVEGMYKELVEKYGKNTAKQIMILEAENKETNEKIKESIDTFGI